jgi:hypothetical protein
MAYKVFSNGDALTGGELNTYLMNQSVMVFASSTARSAALPSPTEGMVTYLEDANQLYLWTGATWQSIVSVTGTGNILINSNFLVNQRAYVSGTALATNAYGVDRWKATSNNSSMTFTYSANGYPVTINSGGSFAQIIEQFNIPGSGSYTLSWSGTATGRVYNSGSTAPSYAASPVTVTLDGTANVVVEFEATGGTKTLEKVQLEKGTSATNWRLQSNGYEAELAKCQRYYQRQIVTSGTEMAVSVSGSSVSMSSLLPVEMRTDPTTSTTMTNANYGSGNWTFVQAGINASTKSGTLTVGSASKKQSLHLSFVGATYSPTPNGWQNLNNSSGIYVELSAEL